MTLNPILPGNADINKSEPEPKNNETICSKLASNDGKLHFVQKMPKFVDKMFFHTHGNEFGSNNTNLEGYRKEETLNYLHHFLSKRFSENLYTYGLSPEILDEINYAKDMCENFHNTRDYIIGAFCSLEPRLIPGGWAGAPGHAIYYEIIPTDLNTATFRIFNLGAGSENHDARLIDKKEKSMPYFDIPGVSKEALLNPNTLEAMKELIAYVTIPGEIGKTNYSAEDIYVKLKALLISEKKEITTLNQSSTSSAGSSSSSTILKKYKTKQHSGICAWRSLLAWLSTKMTPEDYKLFICDIKMQGLHDAHKEDVFLNQTLWRLLTKSEQKMARTLAQAYEKSILTHTYANEANEYLNKISSWLELNNKNRIEKRKKNIEETATGKYSKLNHDQIKVNTHQKKLIDCTTDTTSGDDSQPCGYLYDKITSSQNIQDVLNFAKEAIVSKQYHALNLAGIEYIKKINTDMFVSAIKENPHKAHEILNSLGEFAKLFFISSVQMEHSLPVKPERLCVFLKILDIQKKIGSILKPENNEIFNFITGIQFRNLSALEPYFCISDPNFHQEFESLISEPPSNSYVITHTHHINVGNYNYRPDALFKIQVKDCKNKNYCDAFPEVAKAMIEQDRFFVHQSDRAQNALIFTSSHLPEWYRSIRDTYIYFLFLGHDIQSVPQNNKPFNAEIVLNVSKEDIFYDIKDINNFSVNDTSRKDKENANNRRFAKLFKPEQSLDITKLNFLSGRERRNITKTPQEKNLPLSYEEYQDLSQIFQNTNTMISKAFAFFKRNPSKLANSDYQAVFENAFLFPSLLNKEMAIPGFTEAIGIFLQSNLSTSMLNRDIHTSIFIIRMMRIIGAFALQDDKVYFGNSFALDTLLEENDLEPEEKSLVYAEIAAQHKMKTILTNTRIFEILKGTVHIKERPIPELWENQNTREAFDVLQLHASKIRKLLVKPDNTPNHEILAKLVKELKGVERKKWKLVETPGNFPSFFSEDEPVIAYYPLLGTITMADEKVNIPSDIKNHPYFQQLFPGINKAKMKSNRIYEFDDAYGNKTCIQKNKSDLRIEQLIEGKWHLFIPRSACITSTDVSIASLYLVKNYNHWIDIEGNGDLKIISPLNGKIEYKASYDNQHKLISINRIKDGLNLGRGYLFHPFEESQFVHYWYQDSNGVRNLKQVELPRYNLSFTYSQQDQKLYCDQYAKEGFFYSENQSDPLLGTSSFQIVLQNSKGDKKFLFPILKLGKFDDESHNSLQPQYSVGYNLRSLHQKYITMDTTPDGKITSPSRLANLYLSYMLAVSHEYDSAAFYLKKYGTKVSAFSQDEEDILMRILDITKITGANCGDIIAIRLYAAYQATKNIIDHGKKVPKTLIEATKELVFEYLNHYNNAIALKLSKEEETFLLKFVLNRTEYKQLRNRLTELEPENITKTLKRSSLSINQFRGSTKNKSFLKELADNIPRQDDKSFDIKANLITQFPRYTYSHFRALYQLAKIQHNEKKKWINDAIVYSNLLNSFEESTFDSKHKYCTLLIKCVLDYPDKFPDLPTSQYITQTWWESVLKIADELHLLQMPAKIDDKQPSLSTKLNPIQITTTASTSGTTSTVPLEVNLIFPAIKCFRELCEETKIFNSNIRKLNRQELNTWLNEELQKSEKGDPLYHAEIQRLVTELNDPKISNDRIDYDLVNSDLKQVGLLLQSGKEDAKTTLNTLFKEIETEANCPPKTDKENLIYQLKKQGREIKSVTFDELLIFYGRKNPSALLVRNPNLDQQKINEIFNKIGKYLVLKTHEQQRERAQIIFDKVDKAPSEKEKSELIQQLAETMLEKRQYILEKNPAYLVFEYYSEKILRKAQVRQLKRILNSQSKQRNLMLEMIMGSGKSKVLLPLLGLLRADGTNISMLVVHEPLFENVSTDTQKILTDLGQPLRTIHIDRGTPMTKESLQIFLDDLKSIQKNRECLIMTSKSVHCLILKYIEACNDNLPKGQHPQELEIFDEIMSLIHDNGYPLIDEADTILNVLHEVCFSMGDRVSPNPNEIKLINSLFTTLYNDADLKKLAKFDSDNHSVSDAPVFTEELYHKSEFKSLLATKWLQSLKTITFDSKDLTEEAQIFASTLNKDQQKTVINYLIRNPETIDDAQAFYDKLSNPLKNILALAGEQICNFLPHTLSKVVDEKYGLDDKTANVLAIPFAAANTPNSGSQFATSYITINYTLQYYEKKPLTATVLHQQIDRLQSQAIKEMREDPSANLKDTEAWKLFTKIKGDVEIPLFNIKASDIEKLGEYLNKNLEKKRSFVCDCLLPQLELYTHKISSNPHNLIAFFLKHTGFTGTLWNSQSMHSMLLPRPDPGTDTKTIGLLWENSRDEITTISEGTPEAMILELQDKGIVYDMISDAGGYFKLGGNKIISEKLVEKLGMPVVFYNKNNEQSVTNGKDEILLVDSKIPMDSRKTFLDQIHTTGADVPQPLAGVGIVTIGRNMLLRDLLQSVWRMRGLARSQRVRFILSKEVESIIRQKLNKPDTTNSNATNTSNTSIAKSDTESNDSKIRFEDILRFTILNQVQQQGVHNFKGLREELTGEIQNTLLQPLYQKKLSNNEKEKTFEELKAHWIKEQIREPKDCFGVITREADSGIVIQGQKNKFLSTLNHIYDKLSFLTEKVEPKSIIEKRSERLVAMRKNVIPAKLNVPLRDQDCEQTIEQEIKQERETELELSHQTRENITSLGRLDGPLVKKEKLDQSIFDYGKTTPYFTLEQYLNADERLKEYSKAFDGIYTTLSLLLFPQKHPLISDLQLFGSYRVQPYFIKVEDNGDIILLGDEDFDEVKKTNPEISLMNIFLGNYETPVPAALLEKLVKVRFLYGESTYTKEELAVLEKWFTTFNVEKMHWLFVNKILNGYPDRATRYATSNLKSLFQRLMVKNNHH